MSQTLTPEQLVLFVYDEISDPHDREEISKMVKADSELYDLYNDLSDIRKELEAGLASPSENTIRQILNYSDALSVVHTSDHHTMGLLLN
jgi:hypothetical protein